MATAQAFKKNKTKKTTTWFNKVRHDIFLLHNSFTAMIKAKKMSLVAADLYLKS